MKTIYRLACVLAAAALAFAAVGCGEDDEPTSGKNNTGEQLNPEGDPEGTVTVNIGNDGKSMSLGDISIRMTEDNNFSTVSTTDGLLSVGKVQGLSSVRNVSSVGWGSNVLVQPGYGYVLRELLRGSIYRYARLYVEDYVTTTSGGIMGAKIKYQYPFYPDNTLCFEGYSGSIYLHESNNYTSTVGILHYVPFDVEVEARGGDVLDTDLDVQHTESEITFSTRNTTDTNAYWDVTITDDAGMEQSFRVYVN